MSARPRNSPCATGRRSWAVDSFRRLAALTPSTVCFGHGDPLTQDAAAVLYASARGSADGDSGLEVEHG